MFFYGGKNRSELRIRCSAIQIVDRDCMDVNADSPLKNVPLSGRTRGSPLVVALRIQNVAEFFCEF